MFMSMLMLMLVYYYCYGHVTDVTIVVAVAVAVKVIYTPSDRRESIKYPTSRHIVILSLASELIYILCIILSYLLLF